MKLILIRGLPGSGKSTLAKKLLEKEGQSENDGHFEADMYYIMKDGEYHFNPTLIRNAHQWCQSAVRKYFETQMGYMVDTCVVSNTFTKHWEMQPYLDIAKEFGADVEIVVMRENYGSIHNVPQDVMQRMRDGWEE